MAAMAASSFPQTWDFCVYVGGLDDPEDMGGSPRVKRSLHVQYMGQTMLERKETWKVHMIVRMKIAMTETDSILSGVEKTVVGCCLL